MQVQPQDVAAINRLAAFLALDDFADGEPVEKQVAERGVDCVVLAGNSVLQTAEGAFRLVANGACPILLISGGIGHSTNLLRDTVSSHPVYGAIATEGRSEADIFKDMARTFWSIDESRILIDDTSTNCGENASFSRRVLERSGRSIHSILIVQDPTMQRRTDATFRHVWRDKPGTQFFSWPTFTPQVRMAEDGLRFVPESADKAWPMARFLSLLLGEIPRLRDDASGYGPNGKGFIGHVDIPPDVEAAYAILKARAGQGLGNRLLA